MSIGVTIEAGPAAWQIIQQDDTGHATLRVSGRWFPFEGDAPESGTQVVEARLVYETSACPVTRDLDWTPAEMAPDGRWSASLVEVPAGGLYRVETRVRRRGLGDDRPLRGDYIHCLGVGDLWCIAGQSNASGTGAGIAEDGPELGVHLFGNDETWRLATHPLEDATATLHPITMTGIYHGHSPWLAFAKALKRGLGYPIGLIPAALGGSPLQRWNPAEPGTADLYANMLDMVGLAGGKVRGVVWYQGESDCGPALSASYEERFRSFAASLRRDLDDPHLPILTAQLNRFTTPSVALSPMGRCDAEADRGWSVVREAQRRLAAELPQVAVVPTLDLSLSDNIHNAAAAQVMLGERFARVALGRVYGRPVLHQFAEIAHAQLADDCRTVAMRFTGVSGGWTTVGPVTDFSLEDDEGWVPMANLDLGDESDATLYLARPVRGRATLHSAYGANPEVNLRDGNRQPTIAFSVVLPYGE